MAFSMPVIFIDEVACLPASVYQARTRAVKEGPMIFGVLARRWGRKGKLRCRALRLCCGRVSEAGWRGVVTRR